MRNSISEDYDGPRNDGVKVSPRKSSRSEIVSALEDARALANRIEEMVDHLCGSRPQACGADENDRPSGVIPNLVDQAEETSSRLRRAHAELDRLDAHFE